MKTLQQYIEEIGTDGFLQAALVRSSIRAGAFGEVRIPELPDGYSLLVAEDLPGADSIRFGGYDFPLLARDRISYRGEPIGIIVGPDLSVCMQLRDSCVVTYEREDPVDLDLAAGRLIGGDAGDYPTVATRTLEAGNPDAALEQAFQVNEGEYTINPTMKRLVEPVGGAVSVRPDMIEVWTPSRWIYQVRTAVAAAARRETGQIVVNQCGIDARYDGFLWRPSVYAALAAAAAISIGKPVALLSCPGDIDTRLTAPGTRIVYRTGLTRDGTLSALEARFVTHAGAYPLFGSELLDRMCIGIRDSYACEDYRIVGHLVRTNDVPAECYAGFGESGAAFATEVHAARLSELAEEDPLSWRGRHPVGPSLAGHTPRKQMLEAVSEQSDFARKFAAYEMQKKRRATIEANDLPLRGVGIASAGICGGFLGGRAPVAATVRMRIDPDGSVELAASSPMPNTHAPSIHQRIAAEVLKIPVETVSRAPIITGRVPDSGPSILGHEIATNARLVRQCAETLNRQRFREPLPLEVKRSARRKSRKQWNPETLTGDPCLAHASAAMTVEVEVDPVSLRIAIKGIWATVSIGPVVDPELARTQFLVELADAFESGRDFEQSWEEAGIVRDTVDGARLASVPPVMLSFVEQDGDVVHPVEGLATSVFLPAFVTAVSQATGFYFDSVPIDNTILHTYVETV